MRQKPVFPLVVFFILIILPYIIAAFSSGVDYRFGGLLFNVYDGNSYLAKMYQGYEGSWLFKLPYTSEPGSGAYLFMFYIFLGHLSRWISLPTVVVFHTTRIISAMLLVCSLYKMVDRYSDKFSGVPWIYGLLLLGSGSGWLLSIRGLLGADFWVAEAYPFLSSFATPHFALGLALLVWILLNAFQPQSMKRRLFLSFLAFCLSIVAPFGVVVVATVVAAVAACQLFDKQREKRNESSIAVEAETKNPLSASLASLVSILSGGCPYLLYQFLVIYTDPVLSGWNSQNLTPSISLPNLVAAFSPALILGIIWMVTARREHQDNHLLFLLWLLAGIILLYFPFNLQRRFMMGLFIPVACLAGAGLQVLVVKSKRLASITGLALLLFSIPTNLMILVSTLYGISHHDPLIYLSQAEAESLAWIESNTEENSLILASPEMGLFIPAQTGRRVIYGHPFETVNANDEKKAVIGFFSGHVEMDREAFLSIRAVDFVFMGRRERSFHPPPVSESLEPVFSSNEVTVYQVIKTQVRK